MKLTYELNPDPDNPYFILARTYVENGEPMVDVTLKVPAEIIETQFPAVTATLIRCWRKVNGLPMPETLDYKTLI